MPLPIHLSHRLVEQLAQVRQSGDIKWLRPDSKSQVTCEYDGDSQVTRIETIVISTQHTEEVVDKNGNMLDSARKTIIDHVIKPVVERDAPACGRIASISTSIPPVDSWLVDRMVTRDSLVARSSSIPTAVGDDTVAARLVVRTHQKSIDPLPTCVATLPRPSWRLALQNKPKCNLPMRLAWLNLSACWSRHSERGKASDEKLATAIRNTFNLTPSGIISGLNLLRPIYFETARHGHFGREVPEFTWEATPKTDALRSATG